MTVPLKTRVLLADDHTVVRVGLGQILRGQPDFEVVAEVADGREAVDVTLSRDDIHLAVLDIAMPRLTGLQAAREIAGVRPEMRMIMLSVHDSEQYFFEALSLGASGYVLKTAADRDLVEACRAAMRGEPFLFPGAERALVRDYLARARQGETVRADPLTCRESEILKLIAEGYSGKQIAEELIISQKTVDRHRSNMLEKLGLRDRVGLTRYAIRRGLIEP
jgi:DNA-binding NarL/FixJ family response regulator